MTVAATSLLDLGIRAQSADGDLAAARRWFDAAYREAERNGDTETLAAATLGQGGLWVHEHRTAEAGTQLLARLGRALSLVPPDSPLAIRLRARVAAEQDYRTGRHDKIMTVLAEARELPDPAIRAEVLSLAHHCLLGPDHGPLRRQLADDLLVESTQTGRRVDVLVGVIWQVVDMFLDGHPHAERRLAELRALLGQDDHLAARFVLSGIDVMVATRAGRFDAAEAMAQTCVEIGTAAGDVDAQGWLGGQLVAIRWYQGRLTELAPMLEELVHSPTLSTIDNSSYAALAVAAAQAGDRRRAAGALATLRGSHLAQLPRSSSWLIAMNGVVEAAYLLDDGETAAQAYEVLTPYAHLPMMVSLGVACFGSTHHALGVACLATGDLDRAVTHLRKAIERNLALGHWPAMVLSRQRYAAALAARGAPGDAGNARRELANADEEAARLGMPTTAPSRLAGTAPQGSLTCVRQGKSWAVGTERRSVNVPHCVGMKHLAVLLANPGMEIAAAELATGLDAWDAAAAALLRAPQAVLDRTAAQQYRRRLSELKDEIDTYTLRRDQERVTKASQERDWILAELAAAAGFAGRTRAFPDDSERARLSVGRAIRRALARITDADAVLGNQLRDAIHTGRYCSFRAS